LSLAWRSEEQGGEADDDGGGKGGHVGSGVLTLVLTKEIRDERIADGDQLHRFANNRSLL